MQHLRRLGGHPGNVNQGFQRRVVAHPQADFGDTLSVVPHPLQLHGDVQQGNNGPQVAGHRLLSGDQVDAQVLYFVPFAVDMVILGNQLLGFSQVPVFQGRHGADDGLVHHIGQQQHLGLQVFQLAVQVHAQHSLSTPWGKFGKRA